MTEKVSTRPALLFFQFGDFAADWLRLGSGAQETYRDQRASVDYAAGLARDYEVTVISVCGRSYAEDLAPGLRAVGIHDRIPRNDLNAILAGISPDLLICRSPRLAVLQFAQERKIRTLPSFADIFERRGLRGRLRCWQLGRALRGDHIPCVANHSLNASLSVVDALGIRPDRVVPWDWTRISAEPDPKSGPSTPGALRVFYAGALSEAKGVGDAVVAIAHLRRKGLTVSLTLAGPGDPAPFRTRAKTLGVADGVKVAGLLPHEDVRREMAAHDVVIVPSRHAYPEGLPNVIYEGLASRSPLVISDHPAFRGRLKDGEACLEFRASDPRSLAATLTRLLDDPSLYGRLSAGAAEALDRLYVGVDWTELVDMFLADPANSSEWVGRNSLSAFGFPGAQSR